MGNSSSKDERRARPADLGHHGYQVASGEPSPSQPSPGDRLAGRIYANRNGSARGSRHDLSFMQIVRGERDNEGAAAPERVRETRQEREARRAERDRQARLREREKSMREEHVDGGYLVTVGVYTGPEDFSKQVVRQLQIERRLAPFWKGLDDHNDSWTEAQLVAAARDLPIPEPDSIPPDMARTGSQSSSGLPASDVNVNSLMVPITSRSQSYQSDQSASLSSSHPAFSGNSSGPSSLPNANSPNNPLFRGRAKTLASTLTGGKSGSQDLTPQEIRLPGDRFINGQALEAHLYKDASECPICFLYYPPYLNRTRCCDQSICSECFVQIKRPDPHPPEHEQPGQPRPAEEEAETLVSEVAACPFCVTPEFGVTYEPPPFRRGLAYAHQQLASMRNTTSAMSSSSSLGTGAGRRRATSLSANAPGVVTTDRVRPDWYKKLTDARAQALRRSAAATALHNAAYVLGNQGDGSLRSGGLIGRRRRTFFADSPNASGSGTPREGMSPAEYEAYFRPANGRGQGDGGGDLVAGRSSSRRHRVEDIEELMMMEAIRQSLADEEDRKRKEEKAAGKDAKKKAKADKKEEKKAEKAAKKNGGSSSLYRAGTNDSTSTYGSIGMARSSSNLGNQPTIPEEQTQEGKGKQPVQDFAGFNPLSEPSSTLNRGESPSPSTAAATTSGPQRHLEESRANLQPNTHLPLATPSPRVSHFRQLSNASSAASSFVDAPTTPSSQQLSHTPTGVDVTAGAQQDGSNSSSVAGTPSNVEPMFNFRSLAAMMGEEDKHQQGNVHIEDVSPQTIAEEELKEPSTTGSPRMAPATLDGSRARGDSGESSSSAPPRIYVEHPPSNTSADSDEITSAPTSQLVHDADSKEFESIDVADHRHAHTNGIQ